MITEKLNITLSYNIALKQTATGLWEAWHGTLGSVTAHSKEECLRILRERAQQNVY